MLGRNREKGRRERVMAITIPKVTANDTQCFVSVYASSWMELFKYIKRKGCVPVITTSGEYWA